MSHLLDDDDDLGAPRDRELTLSTTAILGIFFGLVVLCGLFFGFGYSVGRHKPPSTDVAAAEGGSASPSTNFTTFKPAAGSPAGGGSSSVVASPAAPAAPAPSVVQARTETTTYVPASSPSATSSPATAPTTAPIVRQPPVSAPPQAAEPSSPTGTGSFFMVQIAAVSHQEDADLLLSALRSRGYTVMSRTYSSDPLIHIQVGPFNTRKDADAMRNRLLGDGYNAIVK
ncbi:Sporulation related domain-containing protein [Bryocella elongata]|uniref:Sporulation related domain-containing protein n=1 Tax=Bryocella elongata TaxID=863522 RepID=A0A1H6BAA5_9BACT|nr:SPOR domain-containing protein [Bryocella elongata]SEG57106.1 Sporulation related domain-containing protein [Bryocella elongata]